MDRHSSEVRSKNMSAVRARNTKPEHIVRSLLHRMGYRFRLHAEELPGKPDIILPKYRTVIFVHGCFWHQHPGCKKAKRPATRIEFWDKKLDDNITRDARNYQLLSDQGWRVLVVWECEMLDQERLAVRLRRSIKAMASDSDEVV